MNQNASQLEEKLGAWLSNEGYPLEYHAAAVLRNYGLDVNQGHYVRSGEGEKPRELDIVADVHEKLGKAFLRVSTVVECKYSKDKPWVVFTSRRNQIAPSACIAQTIGSVLGDTLLWMISGDADMHAMDLFSTPTEPGFGGRQAFASGNDLFYSTLAAVTAACVGITKSADRGRKATAKSMPKYGLIALPVVVIDGRLFRATHDGQADRLVTEEVSQLRCHWRGSADWPLHATVDIVTREGLSSFAERRADDMGKLMSALSDAYHRLENALSTNNWDSLALSRKPTGRSSLPALLSQFKLPK